MAANVNLDWTGAGLVFEGGSPRGDVRLASGLDEAGDGPTPMELLLLALGGCGGMDVVSILGKMRQPLTGFGVEVSGETREEHPQIFTEIQVVYRLRGDLDEEKVRRAIQLSETKYCPVGGMLGAAATIRSRYEIEP